MKEQRNEDLRHKTNHNMADGNSTPSTSHGPNAQEAKSHKIKGETSDSALMDEEVNSPLNNQYKWQTKKIGQDKDDLNNSTSTS